MGQIVVDCSVAMSWFLEDEYTDYSRAVRLSIEQGSTLLVPDLWHVEIANVFLISERRGRITEEETRKAITALYGLTIATDHMRLIDSDTMELARLHNLTAYDALYVALAKREGLPFATLDKKLRSGAESAGITLL